jgi:ApaG protein
MNRIPRRSRSRGSPIYETKTRDVLVRVLSQYLPEESEPENGLYYWAYTVEIENHGLETLTLISRHWVITDALNQVTEVRGEGVIGEQPVLKPREAYRYTSGSPLRTTTGSMHGSYQMQSEDGEVFDAEIPLFSLDMPGARKVLN